MRHPTVVAFAVLVAAALPLLAADVTSAATVQPTGTSPDTGAISAEPSPDTEASSIEPDAGDAGPASHPTLASRSPANGSSPKVVALYPNPVADGDPGEFVAVHFPEPTNVTGWTIEDDGRQSAVLPNRTVEGTVAFALDPGAAARHTDYEVLAMEGRLQLADGGERIELRTADGVAVDAAGYDRAPEAEQYVRIDDGWEWVPLGATEFEPTAVENATATAFVLPDAPGTIEAELRDADRRVLLAGYTLTSERVVEALIDANDDGLEVAVLVEGGPVGGITERQSEALDRLTAAGVPVTVLGGDHARYRNHHAKYAVIDDRALVTTENWKPAGTGGAASRGWGVVLDEPTLADDLAAVFEADRSWRDGVDWETYRGAVDPVENEAADGEFRGRFAPERIEVERAQLLVVPDSAEGELVDLVGGAEESIRIKQVQIGEDDPILAAAIEAARRGVEVELLLSSAWYAEEKNRALAADLRALADEEDLDLTVELVDPRSRFRSVHAKGAIVDDRHVVLGSLNWNPTAIDENREVVVVLTGEEVADYYGDVFRADRRGGVWRLPAGVGAVVGTAWLTVGVTVARRIEWSDVG